MDIQTGLQADPLTDSQTDSRWGTHAISQSVFDHILAFVTKIFLPTCDHNPERAMATALEALAEYDPRTNRELRFAALALAFSLGALDALSQAMDPGLSVNQALRMRSSANALHRSARQAEEALAEERDAAAVEETDPEMEEETTLPASADPEDLVAFTRATPPLSRQQRRKREREAARRKRREDRASPAAELRVEAAA